MKVLEENYISAVAVARDGARFVKPVLESLDGALSGMFANYEIIIVDNFSGDGTAEALRSLEMPATIVTLARWHGAQDALTAGVELAIGDYILEIPFVSADTDFSRIGEMYGACQNGADFVFLAPAKTALASRLFYRLLNYCYRGQTALRFASSLMTLSSRRGLNKTAESGTRMVNRNVAYMLTGLACASIMSSAAMKSRRSFRENYGLITDTLIFHTDLISGLAFRTALFFFGMCALAIVYSLVLFFVINTAPGWASTFILIAVGFGALFSLLAVICKYLSGLIKLQAPKSYVSGSVEKIKPK